MSSWLPWPPPHKEEVLTEDGLVFWMNADIGYSAGWYFSVQNREDGSFDKASPKWYIDIPPIPNGNGL